MTALLIVIAALVLGALLNCLHAPPKPQRGIDVYVNGHRVELVPLSSFVCHQPGRAPFTFSADDMVTIMLDGVLIRGLVGDGVPRPPVKSAWAVRTERSRQKARAGQLYWTPPVRGVFLGGRA